MIHSKFQITYIILFYSVFFVLHFDYNKSSTFLESTARMAAKFDLSGGAFMFKNYFQYLLLCHSMVLYFFFYPFW